MPTNLYGPGDNYHPTNSHVIPGLIKRFHDAKTKKKPYVKIWGTGTAKREFLYIDDMASACIHVMNLDFKTYKSQTKEKISHINAGSGKDLKISELARIIKTVVGYKEKLNTFNKTRR